MLHILWKEDCSKYKEQLKNVSLLKSLANSSIIDAEFEDVYACSSSNTCLDYGYMTCPHCKKITRYRITQNKSTEKISCDSCGNSFLYTSYDINDTYPSFYILRNYPLMDDLFKTGEMVGYDDENGKLWIYQSFVNVFMKERNLFYEPFYFKLILDTRKHTAYYIGPKTFKGKIAFGESGASLVCNCTYAKVSKYIGHFSETMIKRLGDELHKIHGYPVAQWEEFYMASSRNKYKDSRGLCYYLIWLNSRPNMMLNYSKYKGICSLSKDNLDKHGISKYVDNFGNMVYDRTFFKKLPTMLTDSGELVDKIANQYNLPKSKKFRRLYMKNMRYMEHCMFFKKIGFKNPDILLRLIQNDIFLVHFKNLNVRPFLKYLVKNSGEHRSTKKIEDVVKTESAIRSLKDTIDMFNRVHKKERVLLKEIKWNQSMREIHDQLSCLCTKLKYKNEIIPYKKEEYALEHKIGDIDFVLAKETHELINVGTEMKICVGAYKDKVISKHSVIVFMKEGSKTIGCIELNSKRELIQVKAARNNPLPEKYKNTFDSWLQLSNIQDYKDCSDYRCIGQLATSDCDYHDIELNENNQVVFRNAWQQNENNYRAYGLDFFDYDLPFA